MVIFNSYVKLPEGSYEAHSWITMIWYDVVFFEESCRYKHGAAATTVS